jgi:ABC-2 type transport system ATP-binding protein
MADQALSLQDVTIRYGQFTAVDGLGLEVFAGEIFGLLGPNGSGKSTTLAAVSGGLALTAGQIRVHGLSSADNPLDYRRGLGLAPQELAFYEELSGEENLRFFGRLYGLRGALLRHRVEETLDLVRLTEPARRLARTYSGGMQRRLNLACALIHRPSLLLLDEPTVGLDLPSRAAIFDCLRRLRDQGAALVFTTHHMEEAELLCDRIGIMDHGRLLALGSLPELLALSGSVRSGRWTGVDASPNLEAVFMELTERSPGNPCAA